MELNFTPETINAMKFIGFVVGCFLVVLLLIWIWTYDVRHNYGLKKGDKFIDKRWNEIKLEVLDFAKDGSGWIRVKLTYKDGKEKQEDVSYEYISDLYNSLDWCD